MGLGICRLILNQRGDVVSSMDDRRGGGSWAGDKVCVSLWKEPVALGEMVQAPVSPVSGATLS